jgi:thioredoxin-like negative regulator of GroEL
LYTTNLAQCLMTKKNYAKAEKLLTPILEQSRGTFVEVKTYYRLALCLVELDECETAKKVLKDI